jgi:hypothetical protein
MMDDWIFDDYGSTPYTKSFARRWMRAWRDSDELALDSIYDEVCGEGILVQVTGDIAHMARAQNKPLALSQWKWISAQ